MTNAERAKLLRGLADDIEAGTLLGRLEARDDEIERLTAELDMYHNGYQGSCMACEPVGVENQRLRESLRQCMAEIDGYIDQEYPPDAHPLYERKNRWAKEANPARVALGDQMQQPDTNVPLPQQEVE